MRTGDLLAARQQCYQLRHLAAPLKDLFAQNNFIFSHVSLHLGVRCQQLSAVKDEESSLEGSTVTLTYKYSKQAAGTDWLYWYRQHPGKPPEFLMYHLETQNATEAGLSATVSGDKNQITLKISSAAVTDSAVYYCAVKPTLQLSCLCPQSNTVQVIFSTVFSSQPHGQ
uniref:Immunoglobulin V-set domain-containing protein n=1 Tax=Stegastes partitus TaxID=144197 RepID=A0A3B4ZWL0_9TELE